MQLVACRNCPTQYDVSGVAAKSFPCRCGEPVENSPPAPVDAEIRRCGACGALTRPQIESCEYCDASIRCDDRNLSLICPESWLDADELERTAGFVLSGRRPAAVLTDVPRSRTPGAGGALPGPGGPFGASDARQDGGFAGSLVDVLFGFSK